MNPASTVVAEAQARRRLPPPERRRAIRVATKTSLGAIGRDVGVSRQAVTLWERGECEPRGERLVRYVELLEELGALLEEA